MEAGIAAVFAATAFVDGPPVADFEHQYAAFVDVDHCVGVANGTDALELALRAAGVGPEGEVVIPANTFIATAEAVSRIGAVPVLVDCDDERLLIDPDQVEGAITDRTQAVVPVHLFGQLAPMERLAQVCGDAGVPLVEDAAQSQGARLGGRGAGALGTVAATSFYPGKNLGAAGDAGAVTTDDATIAAEVRRLRNHGSSTRYVHDVIGMNSRLDTVQAVYLRAKLDRLEKWNELRVRAAARYDSLLADVPGVRRPLLGADGQHVWHLYVVRVAERDRVLAELGRAGVGAGIHYPYPVHLTGAYAHLGLGPRDRARRGGRGRGDPVAADAPAPDRGPAGPRRRGARRRGGGWPVVTTLLVANDGGHLMQLHTLRPRLGVGDDVVWVTPRTPQTESLLAGQRVHWALPCPPRDTRALARNALACRRLFADHDVSLVVSTGAALALAVLPQARLRGIETVYIESATRLDAPSLSGRALAMVPGITTFSQSSALARGHWQFLASPWELYETAPAAERPVRSMVVSLGTQDGYGFRRLLDRLVPLVPEGAEVLWQTGGTDVTGLGIDARERVPSEEMAAAIRAADVVVAHAGTGIALMALENGKCPILVPRRAMHGEHVDDHQLTIALELALRDLCISRDADSLKARDLVAAASRTVTKVTDPPPLHISGVRIPRQSRRAGRSDRRCRGDERLTWPY